MKMVREWNPQPAPTWVTCVPSLRHPDLVPDFARRLAAALGLPFHTVLAKTDDRPEQKTMANSTQQARNIDGSLALSGQPVPHGPGAAGRRHGGLALDADRVRLAAAQERQRRGLADGALPSGARPMTPALSPNTQAILLLTAPLIAGRGAPSPDLLSPGEYKRLARHLREMQRQPADLLSPDAAELLRAASLSIDEGRLQRLLGRGFLLSQVIERWQARAIWVVSRADAEYPRRLKARLREDAPAVLYGCGDIGLLESGGLAVVGSRHVDDALIDYAMAVGRLAARAGRTLVSGGAKGIDQAAMRGALEAGGKVSRRARGQPGKDGDEPRAPQPADRRPAGADLALRPQCRVQRRQRHAAQQADLRAGRCVPGGQLRSRQGRHMGGRDRATGQAQIRTRLCPIDRQSVAGA